MTDNLLNVLFLCRDNSTLGIFAEAIINRLGRGKFRGYSAGVQPAAALDPLTVYELEHNNYDPASFRVQDWREFATADAPPLDFVIALSPEVLAQGTPAWPGNPMTAVWPVSDPTGIDARDIQRKAAYVRALSEIESRVSIFVNLPIGSLDRLKLQQRLNEIGGARQEAPSETVEV